MTKYEMTSTGARAIRRKLARAWIPEKGELGHLILPSDSRYYQWGFCGGAPLAEEKRQITEWLFALIQSDILRVSPQVPPEREAWWIDGVDKASTDWCHHDPEMGYLTAKLLCVRFRDRLLRGWRVCGAPEYAGGIADLGLIDPKHECIIAVELGDTYSGEFVEGFFSPKLRQLWYFPYHGLLSSRHYQWQRKGSTSFGREV